jgi:hypothetical protein
VYASESVKRFDLEVAISNETHSETRHRDLNWASGRERGLEGALLRKIALSFADT